MIKIVSGKHPYIPTPPLLYGGSELEASLTAYALIKNGFKVCLDAIPRSIKTWDYYFDVNPPSLECRDVELTINYLRPEGDIHVFQGRPFFAKITKVFASKPQRDYYRLVIGPTNDEIIPNAIPDWMYQPRERWDGGEYYLFLNRCDENKGCAEFVDWCIKNGHKCEMITQNWFVENPSYTNAVLEKARNHGIKVSIGTSPLEKIEKIKGAKAVVAFLSKNYFEGYGIWIHEANWLRVPVISTRVPAVPWTAMRGKIGNKVVQKDETLWRKERSFKSYEEKWMSLVTLHLLGDKR